MIPSLHMDLSQGPHRTLDPEAFWYPHNIASDQRTPSISRGEVTSSCAWNPTQRWCPELPQVVVPLSSGHKILWMLQNLLLRKAKKMYSISMYGTGFSWRTVPGLTLHQLNKSTLVVAHLFGGYRCMMYDPSQKNAKGRSFWSLLWPYCLCQWPHPSCLLWSTWPLSLWGLSIPTDVRILYQWQHLSPLPQPPCQSELRSQIHFKSSDLVQFIIF